MSHIDQFESVFRSADKAVFHYRPIQFEKVWFVTDLSELETKNMAAELRPYLAQVLRAETEFHSLCGPEFQSVSDLLEAQRALEPDLIVTYRHLHSDAWKWPYGLGEHLEVLTQETPPPVLVLPHPEAGRGLAHILKNTDRVMAITDHLTGDDQLVNMALALTEPDGHCYLAHLVDGCSFDRLLESISKIPEIDTELAREKLLNQLLKEPSDYIDRCIAECRSRELPLTIDKIVGVGHRLREYTSLVAVHQIDLLLMHTKDEDQLAMHGLSYPLAVEIRQVPLLLM